MKKENLLTILILAALVLGSLVGHFALYRTTQHAAPIESQYQSVEAYDAAKVEYAALKQAEFDANKDRVAPWKIAGDVVLIRPLMLLIVPLVFTSVLLGIISIGDPTKLGFLGSATIVFYVITMILSVTVGVLLAVTFKPGVLPADAASELTAVVVSNAPAATVEGQGLGAAWMKILYLLVPRNFLAAATEQQMLSIITATIVLGIALTVVREKGRPFVEMIEGLHEALMLLIRVFLWLLPIGIFFLMSWAVGLYGLKTLVGSLGKFVLVVVAGLGIHAFVTLPLILWLLGRCNPFVYFLQMRRALLMAFGTASSLATLPVTMETCVDSGKCSKRATSLVLPLGATVNMDGTALYQGIAVIFLFQIFGTDLEFTQYLVIVLTATLAAVGAAGVPGGSLATILIIVGAVNTSLAGIEGVNLLPEAAIGIILGVDRFLDMCRTSVNVWGDSVGTKIISRLAPDTDEEREEAFA